MPINVFINGKKLFDWTGNSDDVARMDQEVARIAGLGNHPPEKVVASAVRHTVTKGGFFSNNPSAEMLFVMWWLLWMPTSHPHHPGRYRDYIELWDFNFDISTTQDDPNEFHVDVRGAFNVSGTA